MTKDMQDAFTQWWATEWAWVHNPKSEATQQREALAREAYARAAFEAGAKVAAAPEPDMRGPEVGDIVAWRGSWGQTVIGVFGKEITQGDAVILMRRAEVEERMGGKA